MGNNRKAIRDAVQALLVDATSVGSSVFTSRETALWEAELPAILISTGDEEGERRDMNGRQYIRTIPLNIIIKTQNNDTLDDDLDDLSNEVETILGNNLSLIATVIGALYKSTQKHIDVESETQKGVATLTYELKYIG